MTLTFNRSPRSSVIRVLVLCQSTKCKFWWYYDYSFSIYGPLANMAQTDHVTLRPSPLRSWRLRLMRVVDLHPYTMLKFVSLAIWKIWRTMCVSINGPRDPDLETGMRVASEMGNLYSKFGHARPFGFSNYSLCKRRTDRQTDKSNVYRPASIRGHNNATIVKNHRDAATFNCRLETSWQTTSKC